MARRQLSPFLVTGRPVPAEEIVDRESYLDSAQQRLRDGHSLYLAGPRRTGKSSVVGALLERFRREGFYTVYLDLFAIADQVSFARRLAGAVLANRRPPRRPRLRSLAVEPSLAARGFPPELKLGLGFKLAAPEPEPAVLLDRALELPGQVAREDQRGMIVVFDEFQEIEKLGAAALLRQMRGHFQQQRDVAYVFLGSGSVRLREMFGNAAEPFFRFAEPSHLPPVPRARWASYLEARFAGRGLTIPTEIVAELVEAAGGHPADTMLVASQVYYAARDSRVTQVTGPLLRTGYQRALEDLGQYFGLIWSGLGQPARRVAINLVEHGQPYAGLTSTSAVARALATLEELGLAERLAPRHWQIGEPMFAEWLRRARGGPATTPYARCAEEPDRQLVARSIVARSIVARRS